MSGISYKDDDNFFVTLVKLLLNLALLVIPFVIPFYLPATLVIAYWVLAHLAEWVENRIRGEVDSTFMWMLGSCFGVSYLLGSLVSPGFTGIVVCIVCFIALLVVHKGWQKLVGLNMPEAASKPRVTECTPLGVPGSNAWSGQVPVTPEGEAVRVLSCSEFVMGGPAVCDYLLPDGSVIYGGGASSGFSPNGRYFVTPAPSRTSWPLMIYERKKHVLHICDVDSRFWEIDLVGDLTITGRESPLVSNKTWSAMIDDLIAHAQQHKMVQVAGLWITQQQWDAVREVHERAFPGPVSSAGPVFDWQAYLPPDLTTLDNPLEPLHSPEAEISVDQVASGLLISMAFPEVHWRDDQRAMVCKARRKDAGSKPQLWLWTQQQGWCEVPAAQDLAEHLPYGVRGEITRLDNHYLHQSWELQRTQLSDDDTGLLSYYSTSALEIDGQVFAPAAVRQLIGLEPGQAEQLQSAPLYNGDTLTWHLSHIDEPLNRAVYHCEFRGIALEGQWLLDHRVCNTGRQMALVAYAAAPAASCRMAILDADTAELQWLPERYLAPQLQGFADGRLYFMHVTGRQPDALPAGLDAEVYQATGKPSADDIEIAYDLPPFEQARDFVQPHPDWRLLYTRASVATPPLP